MFTIMNSAIAEHARDRTEERNTLAKQVMQDIEAQRKGAGR